MPRKPNYQFERLERQRNKAAKLAEKAAAKREQRERDGGVSDEPRDDLPPSAGEDN